MIAIQQATRGRSEQNYPEAALQPFDLNLPANSGVSAFQRQGHLNPKRLARISVPRRLQFAFPLGEQKRENHQIDSLLFAG